MVKQSVLIDTSILIDYLRQSRKQAEKTKLQKIIENNSITRIISSAAIQELFAGQSSKLRDKEFEIRNMMRLFKIVPVNTKIAEIAGKLMRDNSTVIKFADAQIAATSIMENTYLATMNKKHFDFIEGVKLYED